MTGNDYIKIAGYHDAEKAKRLEKQYAQLWAIADVDCSCGKRIHFMDSFRCLYCGEFFCQSCAEKHFNRTVREWLTGKHPESLRRWESAELAKYCKLPEPK